MKSLEAIEHTIECFTQGRWRTVPDPRQLEAGDIIRFRNRTTGRLVRANERIHHVLVEGIKVNVRAPTQREFKHLTEASTATP
jgi:hypothetical protein